MMLKQNKKINNGIEVLRILSMFFVLTLHILLAGGVLKSVEFLSANYYVAWLIEILAFCAVNCYALISGYVGYGTSHKYSKIITTYLQVLFYTIPLSLVYHLTQPNISIIESIKAAIFPFTTTRFWYFDAYLGLFFLMPFLDIIIEKTCKSNEGIRLFAILIILFSVLPSVFHKDIFETNCGYAFLWVSVLYVVGALCKQYDFANRVPTKLLIPMYFLPNIILFVKKMISETNLQRELTFGEAGIQYDSPLILCASIALLLLFAKIRIPKKIRKSILPLAPTTFGVYIIHMCPHVYEVMIVDQFIYLKDFNAIAMCLLVLVNATVIFLVCSHIELFRIYIFKKVELTHKIDKILCYIKTTSSSISTRKRQDNN